MTYEDPLRQDHPRSRGYLLLAVAAVPLLLLLMIWLQPMRGGAQPSVSGRYHCSGVDDRQNRYEILLQIRARDEGFLLLWSENNGRVSARGIGVRDGSKLVVSFTNGRAIGVAHYAISAGALTGRWWGGQGAILTETCQQGEAREARR